MCSAGCLDLEAANECADFFGVFRDEFVPLDLSLIPSTYSLRLPRIDFTEIAFRLRTMRKPRSMVPGDIFPQLVSNYSVALALPLETIYNAVTSEFHWPCVWKREFVTVIPKGPNPEGLG